jgi:O-antigen/teichoic acid export membrane protein
VKLPRSSTLMPMFFYAASGGAYAFANLLLARRLPERNYALFTLVLTMMTLAPALAAAGLDAVAVRGGLRFVRRVALRVWLAAAAVAIALALATATYGVAPAGLGLILVAGTAGGSTVVAAAEFQRRHRFVLSLMLLHAPNYALLAAAGLGTLAGVGGAWLPLAAMAAGFVVAAACGWRLVLAPSPEATGSSAVPWREALALASTNVSGSIMTQLDRLIIPYVLPLGSLATYGALSSVAGSLFRVVQRGVGYALLPRLRAAPTVAERRRLVAGEARLVAVVALVGSLLIWLVMPAVEHWLLADRYQFSGPLVLATLVVGSTKLLQAFSRAAVTALADARELRLMNLFGWASLAISVAAAAVGARWGLVGVIYGVGLGWAFRTLAALAIMYQHLRPVEHPATY